MTNEQLAVLIRQYLDQLIDIYNKLEAELENLDLERLEEIDFEWIGEGEEPNDWLTIKSISSNYKQVRKPTGNIVALEPLSDLIDKLNEDIDVLENK